MLINFNEILLLLFFGFVFDVLSVDPHFSGLFRANIEEYGDHYAAAYIVSKGRFLGSIGYIKGIGNLEGATFSVIEGSGTCKDRNSYENPAKNCTTLLTRDYLDFAVEHLSQAVVLIQDMTLHEILLWKVRRKNSTLKSIALSRRTVSDFRLKNQTLAVITFSSMAARDWDIKPEYGEADELQKRDIRRAFLETTFWSVFRYIRNIIVCVSNQYDYDRVKSLKLPFKRIINLSATFWSADGKKELLTPRLLPKFALLTTYQLLTTKNSGFERFQYIYYTEGDQILHMRTPNELMDNIDYSQGRFAMVPHRLQAMVLPKDIIPPPPPKVIHWPDKLSQRLANVELITESVSNIRGSCCEDGRFSFKNCGNFWYHCHHWGLSNYTTWMKFGTHGFTMPTGTEHQAKCKYSAKRKLCNLPTDCYSRMPSEGIGICNGIATVERTFGS